MSMENLSSSRNPQIFSVLSLVSPTKIFRNKNPPSFRTSFFKFSLRASPILPLRSYRYLTVSTHFDRPARRRINHLRRKLIQQQVPQNPNPTVNHPHLSCTLENPVPKFEDINDSLSNLGDSSDDVDYSSSKNPGNDNLPHCRDASKSNTVLWNQLEGWANQYKANAEFWGIGSNSIFTVFQGSNGKIDKVHVNEDEILRRSRFQPSLNEVENVKQVQKEISQAKFLAKQMENAERKVIPPNTSVAKFVHSCAKSGFRGAVTSLTSKPGFFPKLSKAGISVLSLILVFMALNILSRKEKGDDKEEYSSLEKEMLRRKLNDRLAKEKSRKASSVEVIQDEPEMLFKGEKPQLDKEKLMNSIAKEVKAMDDDNSLNFDDKIREIRAMARHAREKDERTSNVEDDDDKEVNHIETKLFDVPQGESNRVTSQEKGIMEVLRSDFPNIHQSVVEDKRILDTEKLASHGSKLSIISSVMEAREYLHRKGKKFDKKEKRQELEVNNLHEVSERASNDDADMLFDFSGNSSNESRKDTSLGDNGNVLTMNTNSKDASVKGSDAKVEEELGRAKREKWMEDNFYEFEPLLEKIRGGFRNNYMVAREKVKDDVNLVSELNMLERDENASEFEWMKDEKLREIVFKVRENELMGRDPFYLMDTQDRALFFKGLEKKVERENEKLRDLHEYLHSNIENLDYGADGISLYDPPEKIIPRWKGPPPAAATTILDDYLHQRKALFAGNLGNLDPQRSLQSSIGEVESKKLGSSKTVIEGSDGSMKPGKKSGKEFWQHTKKWSRGFIDSYNAENDPETKAAMKDIGKDLDRWITEKEIQDAATAADTIMDKVPDKGKEFIAEKINKLKKEIEIFGPQAVVSKYSEYGDEEEIDYYWWLDLPFLLCIELYITGDEDERIGFYSLEMASDLELDPKPHHIIAFEDAGDCKNLCYIIQAHMEMLGNGNAFVVPQLPKDTYREAKANGFNVTVIRKGELKLDVDQTLEEVEEKFVEIGSKMYHDQIMKARNVDVGSVMKGVFGVEKPPTKRRRWKKKLKKPTK